MARLTPEEKLNKKLVKLQLIAAHKEANALKKQQKKDPVYKQEQKDKKNQKKINAKEKALQKKEKEKIIKLKKKENKQKTRLKQSELKHEQRELKKDPNYQAEQRAKKQQLKEKQILDKFQAKERKKQQAQDKKLKKIQDKELKKDPAYQAEQAAKKLRQKEKKASQKIKLKERKLQQAQKEKLKKNEERQLRKDPIWREEQKAKKIAAKTHAKEKKIKLKEQKLQQKQRAKEKKALVKERKREQSITSPKITGFTIFFSSKLNIALCVLILFLICGAGGYAGYMYFNHPSPEKVTIRYLDAFKEDDAAKLGKYGDDQFQFVSDTIMNDPLYASLKDIILAKIHDFDYIIGETIINEQTAEVQVTITTTNLGEPLKSGIEAFLKKNYVLYVSGKKTTAEMTEILLNQIQGQLNTTEKSYEETITVYAVKENDQWKLADLSQTNAQLAKMLTAGMYIPK